MGVESELRELSFQDLITVKNTVGTKKFDSLYKKALKEKVALDELNSESEQTDSEEESSESDQETTEKGPKKRQDKNMPMEMSSKRPVSRKRVVIQSSKPVRLDNVENQRPKIWFVIRKIQWRFI